MRYIEIKFAEAIVSIIHCSIGSGVPSPGLGCPMEGDVCTPVPIQAILNYKKY